MAIVVEDGTIVSGANSYVTAAELTTYATDRGFVLTGTEEEPLLKAMTYIEPLPFQGLKRTKDQPLQWPRDYVVIDSWEVLNTEIPEELKTLQYEVALSIDGGVDPLSTVDRATKQEQLGSLSVTYADKAAPFQYNRKITALERKLIGSQGAGGLRRW